MLYRFATAIALATGAQAVGLRDGADISNFNFDKSLNNDANNVDVTKDGATVSSFVQINRKKKNKNPLKKISLLIAKKNKLRDETIIQQMFDLIKAMASITSKAQKLKDKMDKMDRADKIALHEKFNQRVLDKFEQMNLAEKKAFKEKLTDMYETISLFP